MKKMENDFPHDDPTHQPSNEGDKYSPDVRETAERIKSWREILVNLDRIVNWERPRLLFGIQCAIALGFLMIAVLGPSLLTSLALIGLIATAVDFTVPIVAPRMFESSSWTVYEENHFLSICEKLMYVGKNVSETLGWLIDLRVSRPTFYFTLMSVFFAILAFVGERFNNLLLCFLFINFSLVAPGLLTHNVPTRIYSQIRKVIEQKLGQKNTKRGK